jgi:hypothetical protein
LRIVVACATTIPASEREQARQELNDRAEETLALLLDKKPALQELVDSALRYFVVRMSAAQVAVIRGGVGLGVLSDKEAGTRTYMNVTRYGFGMGVGAALCAPFFCSRVATPSEQFGAGTWKSRLNAETAVGTAGTATRAYFEGASVHQGNAG